MSNQPVEPLKKTQKDSYLEYENFYITALKKQHLDVERWKLKVKMVLNMKNKEVQKMNAKKIELNNLQNKVYTKKIENCDFIHDLIKNSWMANSVINFECLTLITETVKNKTNNSLILNKLEEELNKSKSIFEALNLKRQQDKKLIEYISKIDSIEHSITIWNEEILKIELGISKSKNE